MSDTSKETLAKHAKGFRLIAEALRLEYGDDVRSAHEMLDIAATDVETLSVKIEDLKAALVAADELAKRVAQQQEGWPMRQDYVNSALDAYRKAKEALK